MTKNRIAQFPAEDKNMSQAEADLLRVYSFLDKTFEDYSNYEMVYIYEEIIRDVKNDLSDSQKQVAV